MRACVRVCVCVCARAPARVCMCVLTNDSSQGTVSGLIDSPGHPCLIGVATRSDSFCPLCVPREQRHGPALSAIDLKGPAVRGVGEKWITRRTAPSRRLDQPAACPSQVKRVVLAVNRESRGLGVGGGGGGGGGVFGSVGKG